MKKITSVFILAIAIVFTSCMKEDAKNESGLYSKTNLDQLKAIDMRPRLKFKHTGTSPTAPACEQPLGICIIFRIQAGYAELTPSEIKEGIGTAELILLDENHLKIIPSTAFSYENGTIELEGNAYIDKEVANYLKCSQIELIKGIYNVNRREGEFGSVIVNINSLTL